MGDVDLNMDFTKPVVVESRKLDWVPSYQAGVERRRLEREGAESGRATTIVRYAPAAHFPTHSHPAGEEYLVLEGTFSDQDGGFGKGTYVRNPPGTSHAPFTREGCIIFVKLCQMRPQGEPQIVVDTEKMPWQATDAEGRWRKPLFEHDTAERVALEKLDAGASVAPDTTHGGEEILVLDGSLLDGDKIYEAGTWLRTPPGASRRLSSPDGCMYWVKRGHLQPPAGGAA